MLPLYDIGCRFPECDCVVPYWAFSQEVRRKYCKLFRSLRPNKGNKMNEHTDKAFEPMDKADAVVGRKDDGTVTYQIVEGDTFVNNELVKQPEVVGTIQIEEPKDGCPD